MKKKIYKICGVALALVLVFSLFSAFVPVKQVEAQAYTPNLWNTMTIPGVSGSVLLGADVTDFAVGSDGTTIYATTGVASLETWDPGTAEWTTDEVYAGVYSAELAGVGGGPLSAAKVWYGDTLDTLTVAENKVDGFDVWDIQWNFYYTDSYPMAVLYLDTNNDGAVDALLVAGSWQATTPPGRPASQWIEAWMSFNSDWQIKAYNAETGAITSPHPDYDPTGSISVWKAEFPDATVMYVGYLRYCYTSTAPAAYVDDITIDGVVYELEPSAVLRSTNGGQTFTALVSHADAVGPLKLIAVSPDDPTCVAVVDSVDTVFYSNNGGAVWTNLGAPAAAAENIYDIAISITRSTAILGRDIAVATADPRAGNFGDVYTLGTTTSWAGVATTLTPAITLDFTSVAFEPNWVGGRAIVAVGHDADTSYLFVVRTSTPVTKILNTAMAVTAVDMPVEVGDATKGVISSSLALPNDFDSTSPPAIQAYIGFTSAAGFDDVYRVDLNQTRKLGIAANIGIHSISFLGSRAGGSLFAGQSAAPQVWYSSDPQTAMPTWSFSFKPPTGATNTVVAVAPDFDSSATVYAGTTGVESAFSRTTNGGVSYNQLSLIDTTIAELEDIMPAPDNSIVFLATNDGADASLWLSSTPPSVASWERVRLRSALKGYIIRLSPDYLDDATFYYCDVGGTDIQKTNTGGDIFAPRTAPANIADLTVESKDIVYMGSGTSVFASTNGAWFFGLPIISNAGVVNSLAMAPTYPDKPIAGNLLVGGTTGSVSLSTDGASFIPLLAGAATGAMQVLADKNYADNNLVYAGSSKDGEGIYRYEVGTSTAWEQIRAVSALDPAESITGLAMHCGGLYAAYVYPSYNGNGVTAGSGADRSLVPFLPDIASLTFDRMNKGATAAQFSATPSALRVAGDETEVWLWAINNTTTLMGYNDTMAKAGPAVTVPALVNFDPNTGGNAAFTISWNKISNALGYRVEIYTDAAHTQLVAAAPYNFSMGVRPPNPAALDCYAPPSALAPTWSVSANTIPSGATYYVRVCVRDEVPADAIRSPWGADASFTIKSGVPVSAPGIGPTLLGPIPGSLDVPLKPGFSWGPMAGTTEYEFVLATDATLSSPIAGTPVEVTSPSWQCPEDLEYGTTYFWGIKATAPTSSAQSIGTFTTVEKPVPAPAPPAPPVTEIPPSAITPGVIWAIIAIGAILVIAVIVLIVRTRRIA